MVKLFYFIFSFFIFQISFSQDNKLFHNLDVPVSQYNFERDSNSFSVLQIPLLNFEFNIYSSPRLNSFLIKSNNNLILNLNLFANNINDYSHHIFDFSNSLAYYAVKKNNHINSFGLNHHFFSELSLSDDIVSLIVNGNYQYLNKNIDFSNSFFRGLNYFSFYWGYDKYFSNELVVGAKFKFVKGVSRFGLDIQNVNMSLINNIATENNPFSTNSHIDLYYFTNNNFDIFSNPGLAFDFSMQYKLGQSTFFYTSISELGFIVWQEDQYAYQGSFEYDGLNYDLNQDIAVEFNNLFDSIVNLIDTKDISNVSKVDFLPFSIDLGFTYNTDVNFSKFMINYNLKKLTNSLLHTGSVSYLYYFPSYQICLVPNYSVNKFNYFNLSFFFQKKWFDKLYTNFYLKNCVGFINENSRARNVGFGMELLLLF